MRGWVGGGRPVWRPPRLSPRRGDPSPSPPLLPGHTAASRDATGDPPRGQPAPPPPPPAASLPCEGGSQIHTKNRGDPTRSREASGPRWGSCPSEGGGRFTGRPPPPAGLDPPEGASEARGQARGWVCARSPNTPFHSGREARTTPGWRGFGEHRPPHAAGAPAGPWSPADRGGQQRRRRGPRRGRPCPARTAPPPHPGVGDWRSPLTSLGGLAQASGGPRTHVAGASGNRTS